MHAPAPSVLCSAVIVAGAATAAVVADVDAFWSPSPSSSTAPAAGPERAPAGAGSGAGTGSTAGPATPSTGPSGPSSRRPASESDPHATGTLRRPTDATRAPLLTEEPDESVARSLVAGYPGLLRPAPRSRVVTSSLSPSGGRIQVALVARGRTSPDAVLRFYRTRLAGQGFATRPAPAVGGAGVAAFQRHDGSVVVTVEPRHRGSTRYTVFATLEIG